MLHAQPVPAIGEIIARQANLQVDVGFRDRVKIDQREATDSTVRHKSGYAAGTAFENSFHFNPVICD
jgi:hypothetical protein